MTVINPIDDNSRAWAAWFNALANAHGAGGIVSGCSISKGAGDWDIDVTAGTIVESNTETSITADTVALTDPASDADMDAGESRVDLITADTTDSISVTEGTAASSPATPDIPSGEVLLGFVVIAESDATVADSDIFDVPALMQDDSIRYPAPVYGDGSDGAITRSTSADENGIINATTYSVESGVTLAVSNGVLIILATESITIDGTIDATGHGGSFGAGGGGGNGSGSGGSNGSPGSLGEEASFTGGGSGGSGGGSPANSAGEDGNPGGDAAGGGGGGGSDHDSNGSGDGGNGGDSGGKALTDGQRETLTTIISTSWDDAWTLAGLGGCGGGGGGGGGGGSRDVANGGDGGDGGDGGGVIILISPDITVNGSLLADGEDGSNGANGEGDSNAKGGGGGGGGGGSGGAIAAISPSLTDTGTWSVGGGAGGVGGDATASSGTDGGGGGDGGAGRTGVLVKT